MKAAERDAIASALQGLLALVEKLNFDLGHRDVARTEDAEKALKVVRALPVEVETPAADGAQTVKITPAKNGDV